MFLVSSCSCLCPIHWSQVSSREWRCSWSSADRRCSNYIWVIVNFIGYQGASYIRDLMVFFINDTVWYSARNQHIQAETKWLTCCKHFQMHFVRNEHVLIQISLVYLYGFNWSRVSIGSGNGLVPNRWQAITSTFVDQNLCWHMASLGLNESIFIIMKSINNLFQYGYIWAPSCFILIYEIEEYQRHLRFKNIIKQFVFIEIFVNIQALKINWN